MAGEIIRKGDPTNHGGTVLEGSLTDICHGQPIAYMGHKVSCPQCKGTYPIVEGVLTTTFYGKGVAVAGMKTVSGQPAHL
ncbi:PAAR domain-containing protein [Massilia sp. PAMC28688]|uniref:PAAR domain-containing protein n=1 Tax=Massilia sp. PAMC28688 TaxID=2861283 RepID=UPI001C638B4B|nr:PAAR domain-containing protein [Massilia sp. PAMC28688]QYF92253.1 PAAR domain-containing protein [Massilia sp. PAMC28688]